MKAASWIIRAISLIGTTLVTVSCAGPATPTLTALPIRIQNRAQAEKLREGSVVALACVKCQNLKVASVDEKKRFLSWFSPYEKHGCASCGGKLIQRPSSAAGHLEMIHTCTKCGDNSAFTCASHNLHAQAP